MNGQRQSVIDQAADAVSDEQHRTPLRISQEPRDEQLNDYVCERLPLLVRIISVQFSDLRVFGQDHLAADGVRLVRVAPLEVFALRKMLKAAA